MDSSHQFQPPQQAHTTETQYFPMNNDTSKAAAQTVTSVESQLRHLQLQHAEAQTRLQELTQVAGVLANKVAETEQNESARSEENENQKDGIKFCIYSFVYILKFQIIKLLFIQTLTVVMISPFLPDPSLHSDLMRILVKDSIS